MKKVVLTGDKIYDAYKYEKKDETIVYKQGNKENQLKPDISKDKEK